MQTQSFHIFQKQLGAHLQEIRKSRGLSQEAVGALVDMDRVSIGYIEQGKRAPKLKTLYALAQVYRVDMKEFFEFGRP
jgi:transcriptional regulator with XRE-family HTH domain